MIAKLDGTKNISCLIEKLESLEYETSTLNDKTAFLFRKGSTNTTLKNDIKSVKTACNFIGTIKIKYGSSNASV